MTTPDPLLLWLGQLALGLITATVASWFTVQVSLSRFYREKWWEKRFAAYEEILNALHAMNRVMLEERVKKISPDQARAYKPLTNESFIEPMRVIHKAIDSEGLLVSNEMVGLLRDFSFQLGGTQRSPDVLAESLRIVGSTLPKANKIALKDLGLAPWRWPLQNQK